MKKVVLAMCMIGIGLVSCNRSEEGSNNPPKGGQDMGGKHWQVPTDYNLPPTSLVPPICGGIGQVCCSDGDGLVCMDGLVCVDGSVCKDPNAGSGDMTMVADMSTPDMGSGDSGSGGDMAGGGPDLGGGTGDMSSPPDDDGCLCDDWVNHGSGRNHCSWHEHDSVSPANGHGNGLCRYNCK